MKKLAFATLSLGLGIAAYFGYCHTPVDPPKAYSLYLEERNGEGRVLHEILIAQRADGTRVKRYAYPSHRETVMQWRILRFPDGHRVQTWEASKLMSTRNEWTPVLLLGPQEAIPALPAEDCSTPDYRVAGSEIVDRLTIIHLKQRRFPYDLWRAKELGCEVVGHGGGANLRMTHWQSGEPDGKLFLLDGYTESDSADAHVAEVRALGGTARQIANAERHANLEREWRRRRGQASLSETRGEAARRP